MDISKLGPAEKKLYDKAWDDAAKAVTEEVNETWREEIKSVAQEIHAVHHTDRAYPASADRCWHGVCRRLTDLAYPVKGIRKAG